jgi:hypothetical protein
MSIRIRTIVRNPSTAAGLPGITVSLKRHSDDTTIDTDDTSAAGLAELTADEVGYPGPAYLEYVSGDTYRRSGYVGGQIGGLIWADTINDFMTTAGIGVVPGYLNGLAGSSAGINMNVTVASGMAVLKDGIAYLFESAQSVTMDTADGTNPRIDRIVLRLVREGQAQEGKVTLEKITGSPAASPTAPSITQSSSTWDLSICQVRVNAGVSSIAADKITDERTYCFQYPSGIVAGDMFYVDADGKLARLAKGTSGQVLTQGTTIPAWNTGVTAGGITVNVGNGSDVITSSEPAIYVEIPFAATLTGWMVQNDVSGTITFNVAKAVSGSSTYTDIDGSNPPATSAATTNSSVNMSSWTTAVTANSKLKITVSGSVTSVKRSACAIRFNRT